MVHREYATYIKKLRGKKSQSKFCAQLDIEQPRLSAIENGKKGMSIDIVWRLYVFAKVDPKKALAVYEKDSKKILVKRGK